MARAPKKTCPSLYRLIDEAERNLLAAFLSAKAFKKLSWLETYGLDASAGSNSMSDMLHEEKKERLNPLEIEAARIVIVASDRGHFALEGLASTKLDADRRNVLLGQQDELARSLFAYLREYPLFEAVESSLHLRLYRRYDKHYQTFMVQPSEGVGSNSGDTALQDLLTDLRERLDRGDGYNVDRFDIPEEGDEPAAEMYLLFHPNPPTSVREIDDAGNRSRMYFRPPGEAMIFYTPSTGRVHVRAGTRKLRHQIAEGFITSVLDEVPSRQPVDFQAYDISQFFRGFELSLPAYEDVVVLRARVIRVDASIGNLANRLSLSTTIDHDITEIIDGQPGMRRTFERAVAIQFIEIAVRYRRSGRDREQTLDFTLTDRNTSSLLSLDDAFERVLGHRLLRDWSILHEGRAPRRQEGVELLPALLALWDTGAEKVTGSWLVDRGIDARLLTEVGFLVAAGWEGDDIIDDGDNLGPTDAAVIVNPQGADLAVADGQDAPGGSPERYRVYRVRDEWVAQHLRERIAGVLDVVSVEELNANTLFLGILQIDGRDVPLYLVRRLDDEKAFAATDTEIRARHDLGIGLVLQAGNVAGACLAGNVLTPLVDHIATDTPEIDLNVDSLKSVYRLHRALARGGQAVELTRTGDNAGTLYVPGRGSIHISGEHRLLVISRLVAAHNGGPVPMATADLIKGIEGQSLANIFKRPLWNKLKAGFVRSPKNGLWEIAV